MYYQNYEDYMRSILGYPVDNYYEETRECVMPQIKKEEMENLYPAIYKTVNPIICKTCEGCKEPVTKELVEKLTEEIYQKIEFNSEVMIKVNVENNRVAPEINKTVKPMNNEPQRPKTEIRTEDRQRRPNNSLLQDLIRILILNQLLGGRPPRPHPPRPPFPGGPGMPPPRPPFPGGPGRPPYPMPRSEFGMIEENREFDGYFKF